MAELEIKATPAMRARVWTVIGTAATLTAYMMFLLSGGRTDLLTPRAALTGYMPDATGLATGSEVRLNGIRIGEVRKVELSGLLDPQRAVEVRMRVLSRFLKSIPADSLTTISADTLVGYQF